MDSVNKFSFSEVLGQKKLYFRDDKNVLHSRFLIFLLTFGMKFHRILPHFWDKMRL